MLGLCPTQGAFETGSHDVFSLTTPDITPLRELTLGHDGKGLGAAWYVDTAEMEIVATGEQGAGASSVWSLREAMCVILLPTYTRGRREGLC
jgi:hypothetical protein